MANSFDQYAYFNRELCYAAHSRSLHSKLSEKNERNHAIGRLYSGKKQPAGRK
jgi:hypothetical protein